MKDLRNDLGISENIGVILMVSVVVLGAAIVSVTITSEPAPEEIPNADIIIGCEDATGGTFNVTLFHNGGDTLIPDDLEVRAYDSDNQPIEITLYEGESMDPFAVSDILTFSTDTKPTRIIVIYTGGASPAALKSLDIGSTAEGNQAAWDSIFVDTTVSPTATPTGGGEPTQTVTPGIQDFIDGNVFIYGKKLKFDGAKIVGPGAAVIITDSGLAWNDPDDLNDNAQIQVTEIYINGDVDLSSGSNGLGSPTQPHAIHINGNLISTGGNQNLYGDVYVNGDCRLGGTHIHNDMYIDGDLTLAWAPVFDTDARIFHTGNYIEEHQNMGNVASKCIRQTGVPGAKTLDLEIPPFKSQEWYQAHNYRFGYNTLTSGLKVFADSYTHETGSSVAHDVIIIARSGDISITGWNADVTGVLIAPQGRVTFNGASFKGVVLTRDGFFVTSGSTTVTHKAFESFFVGPDDYPL